jgi:hypothetical protein
MQVLLLVLFLAYLYAPYLLFKFFVEESLDLMRRKDVTRVEEFFGAALPSAILNFGAWAILKVGAGLLPGVKFPQLDWAVAASLLDPTLTVFRAHMATVPRAEGTYLATLYLVSSVAGKFYGMIELRLFERHVDPAFFLVRGNIRRRVAWLLALIYRRIWLAFFAEMIHPIISWMTAETWLYIRTKDDRLYYGLMYEFTKSATGDIDTITIVNAQRYARRTVVECLTTGRSPLTRLSGSFVMKWSEIVDVNIASPGVMTAVRRKYAVKLRAYRASKRAVRGRRLLHARQSLRLLARRRRS